MSVILDFLAVKDSVEALQKENAQLKHILCELVADLTYTFQGTDIEVFIADTKGLMNEYFGTTDFKVDENDNRECITEAKTDG